MSDPLPAVGAGGIAALALGFWRYDRNKDVERYAALAMDFRTIVQDNTAALTKLGEKLGDVVARVPK